MINKLLIANRGEIACRVIKTAKKLGIRTVAIYSQADSNALHVKLADEAILVGDAPSNQSYLRGEFIIQQARLLNVDAIHPGYGFLSENAEFAEQCIDNGIIFVGPPAEAIRAMGSKSQAKRIMQQAQVPLVPGYHDDAQEISILREKALEIGYPVLLKASAGGGGKGMRVVSQASNFESELAAAKRESMNSFGSDHMLIEKYLTQPRHIEIQVFCDNHGNAVYLFERDCSVQRRHQKIIEEAPAPRFPAETRAAMGETAIKAALAIGYQGAGTVEFLYDSDGSFYFMEMNTRLQVEHPVTEMITGLDLVEWQLLVASGHPLPKQQQDISLTGHAIEARIYAEDPDNDFLPSTGTLTYLNMPTQDKHIRIDTGVMQGDTISIFYDPMIAKLIAYGSDRDSAIRLLDTALQHYTIAGVRTNINYLLRVLRCSDFITAKLSTNFVIEHGHQLSIESALSIEEKIAASILAETQSTLFATYPSSVYYERSHFRLNHRASKHLEFCHADSLYHVHVLKLAPTRYQLRIDDDNWFVDFTITDDLICLLSDQFRIQLRYAVIENELNLFTRSGVKVFKFPELIHTESDRQDHSDELLAPMNGTIVDILVNVGDTVEKGQPLAIIEAMKMEQTLRSPRDGVIHACYFTRGDRVDGSAVILQLKPASMAE